MNRSASMVFNILIKKENEMFVAHCMELDIIATGSSVDEVSQDMIDLIIAQLKYAFSNDNLDHLYRPAPPEVWEEFYRCKEALEEKKIPLSLQEDSPKTFVPPWIIAQLCKPGMECHA